MLMVLLRAKVVKGNEGFFALHLNEFSTEVVCHPLPQKIQDNIL